MVVDSKTLRLQDSFGSESGEELCHFLSGITWSNPAAMAWGLPRASSGGEGPTQTQKTLGAIEGMGDSQHFYIPEEGMEVRWEKAERPEDISQLRQEDPQKGSGLGRARDHTGTQTC